MLYVCSFQDEIPPGATVINTTSRSDNWSKGLSPFFVGPVKVSGGFTAKNIENAYQYSKVYAEFTDEKGNPTKEYFCWAKAGWDNSWAHRYPMGKGKVPLYSYWNRRRLSYIEARKQIYIPLYASAVVKTAAYAKLKEIYELSTNDIYLKDFDGYLNKKLNMSYDDVINCETRKMGHAFVLAMLLEGFILVYPHDLQIS